MAHSQRFQSELESLLKEQRLRQADIVRNTGLSSAWVNSMVKMGRIPSREKLQQLVDGLGLPDQTRARLFAAAGYRDRDSELTTASDLYGLPQPVAQLVAELQDLNSEQLETVRKLLENPERLDAVKLLLDARVIQGLRRPQEVCPAGAGA